MGFFIVSLTAPIHLPLAYLTKYGRRYWAMYRWFVLYAIKAYMLLTFGNRIKRDVDFEKIETPCLFACNHRSHLDVFFLLSTFKFLRVISDIRMNKFPLLGRMMKNTKQIPFSRSGDINLFERSMEKVKDGILSGDHVVFFPEMTRCKPGTKGVGRFYMPFFKVAKDLSIPIYPIAVHNTDGGWPKGENRVNLLARSKVKLLEKVDPKDFESTKDFKNKVKELIEKELACGI